MDGDHGDLAELVQENATQIFLLHTQINLWRQKMKICGAENNDLVMNEIGAPS